MSWFQAPEPLLPDLIERHARWRGERSALIDGERRLTWREFERQTACAANGLAAVGLQAGERVALLMDNSLEMAVLLFGILRAGCVAVPLNVSISPAAVAAMIEDCRARAIFASGRHRASIDSLRATSGAIAGAVLVGLRSGGPGGAGADPQAASGGWLEFPDWLAAQSPGRPAGATPDQECNIIYSSGTTGVPKGIVHTHRCRMHWAVDLALALRYRGDCVTLCSLGLFSNISWVAMLCTVLVGGTLVVMSGFEPGAAVRLMARARVSHATFVPLQIERLLAVHDIGQHDLRALDTLMCCGSPLPLQVKREFPRRFDCRLIELYGLTEGLCTVLAPEDFEAKTESVGKPFLGSDLRIVGDDDREVPTGATGEVVGFSPLLMAGYQGNDAASSDATWIAPDGARWLRTGDLGRLDAEGFLYIVDRKKDMIISGGQNIYPADIEAVMRAHPAVVEVAVVGVHSAQWGETPVAVVVPTAALTDPRALVEWTNERVGKQQRIRDVVWRESLPRNANGKVLKRELRRELAGRDY